MIFADADKMKNRFFSPFLALAFGLAFAFFPEVAPALEYVRFIQDGKERHEEGRIVLAGSKEFGFEARDGQFYIFVAEILRSGRNVVALENLITRRSDNVPFVPYTKAEMLERLKEEFPPSEGYYFLDTHGPFIIVYTTSRAFANRCGTLLERLHTEYVAYWRRLGVKLTDPEFPLVAVVLSNEERYRQYAVQKGVHLFPEQRAYYHKLTNRIVLYDMTGQQAFQEGNQRRVNANDVLGFLAQPNNIMTVVHEAVHQVGFNTGMHPRYAPNPVWTYEGLALLHEVPDTRNRSGWTPGPHINRPRLDQLRRYLGKPHQESPIIKMIQDDKLFSNPQTALDNYALAWGITYYLARRRPQELAAYLKILQEKTPESDDSDEIRIREFENCFGSDWDAFDRDFINYIRRL